MLSPLVDEFSKEAARRSIKGRAVAEASRVRRTFPEALTYGISGAVAFPAIQKVRELIEFKGKSVSGAQHFRLGARRIPTRVPAAAATGFLAAGLVPYVQDFVRAHRAQKKLTAIQKQKTAAMVSSVIFKAPQFRGQMRARIAERSKRVAAKRFRSARTTGVIMPGEHRA